MSNIWQGFVGQLMAGIVSAGGKLKDVLPPRLYAYWKFNRHVLVELLDRRVQVMGVQGQEIQA